MQSPKAYIFGVLLVGVLLASLAGSGALAQSPPLGGFSGNAPRVEVPRQPLPEGMKDVGIEERLDAQLPMDVYFTNEMGKRVTLRDCLKPGKPAVLQLGYFGCPMLCDLVSQGMLESMRELDLSIGSDFTVINISFDQRETTTDAYRKKQAFARQYDRPGAGDGWHFLTGARSAISAVTAAVGFKYKWLEDSQQFSHPAAIIILTPEGRVSRYLYGVKFPEQTLRLSLVEASQGRIGTAMDQVLMLCFQYDATAGKYTLAAVGLMRLGGALTVIILATVLIRLFVKEHRARRDLQAHHDGLPASAGARSENT
ncbi:SCO family protein [Fontivita pretiosa]|uniref:SCO family protein n=1 Tax=Fontivita pretiosa TaxID=2989684 RepID=UPI003D184126